MRAPVGRRAALGIVVLATTIGAGVASAAGLNVASQNLTPYRTCTITGTPQTTTAVVDASVRQASATTNFGTAATNDIATRNGQNRRLYVRFDLSLCSPAIPATATVRLATMRLYVTALPTSCRTIDVFRVGSAWTETGLTWNNQPFGATINNPPQASASGIFAVGTPAGCQNLATGTYVVGAGVTTDVAAFVAGSATNFGWMLRDNAEGNAAPLTSTYSGKELATVGQAPQLVVTYVVVP